jgi:putative membrane protein
MTPDRSFLARCTVNAAALWLASTIVPGMQVPVQTTTCLVILLTFAVIYELVRPLLSFLTLPLALVLVIPAKIAVYMLILIATVAATRFLGVSLAFNGFFTIFWAAVAVGLIRLLLTESVRLYETRQTLRRQRKWIQELRQATTWLTEQVGNWQRIVEERQRALHEQQAWIEELQVAKAWLAGQIARHSGMDRIRRGN